MSRFRFRRRHFRALRRSTVAATRLPLLVGRLAWAAYGMFLWWMMLPFRLVGRLV